MTLLSVCFFSNPFAPFEIYVVTIEQSLIDDNLVDQDKIGVSNFFWSFPGKKYMEVRMSIAFLCVCLSLSLSLCLCMCLLLFCLVFSRLIVLSSRCAACLVSRFSLMYVIDSTVFLFLTLTLTDRRQRGSSIS